MKKMVKIAIILTIITILLLAILNSCTRLRSYEYQPTVSYESNSSNEIAEIAEFSDVKESTQYKNMGVVGNILRYEQILLISSIILVIIFCIIFFGINPKKK